MTTEAGRRLLAMLPIIGGYQPDTQAMLIGTIEAEARAALLAELEAGVEGLEGFAGFEVRADGSVGKTEPRYFLVRAAVLDLIRKAGKT